MKYIKALIPIGFVILTIQCTQRVEHANKMKNIEGKFIESGYFNNRTYEFKNDSTFKFSSGTSFFNEGPVIGKYSISRSYISLNPDSLSQMQESYISKTLKVINSKCIRDYENIFYCTDSLEAKRLNEIEYKFQDKIISIMDDFPLVQEQRQLLADFESRKPAGNRDKIAVLDVAIDFSGIAIVNKKELYLFRMAKFDSTYRNRVYVNFLVQKEPIEIYQVLPDESLNLVYN